MILGDFTRVPAVLIAIGWSVVVWRRGYGWWTWALGIAAIAHLSTVASVTLFPLPVQPEVIAQGREFGDARNNIVPLASLVNAVSTGNYPSVINQSVGNLLMLAPLGLYGPLLWSRMRSWNVAVAVGLAVGLAVELLQLGISTYLGFTYKIADVDDLILNTAGVAIGYLAFRVAAPWIDLNDRPGSSKAGAVPADPTSRGVQARERTRPSQGP